MLTDADLDLIAARYAHYGKGGNYPDDFDWRAKGASRTTVRDLNLLLAEIRSMRDTEPPHVWQAGDPVYLQPGWQPTPWNTSAHASCYNAGGSPVTGCGSGDPECPQRPEVCPNIGIARCTPEKGSANYCPGCFNLHCFTSPHPCECD